MRRFRDFSLDENRKIEKIYSKYYSDIPEEHYHKMIQEADPTTKMDKFGRSVKKMGQYSKWIFEIYRKLRQEYFEDLKSKYKVSVDKDATISFPETIKAAQEQVKTLGADIEWKGELDNFIKGIYGETSAVHRFINEDLNQIKESLMIFNKAKPQMPESNRDIGRYKTLQELYNAIRPYSNILTRKSKSADLKGLKDKALITLHDSDEWLVIIPLNFTMADEYGSGTRWCTTGHYGANQFSHYASRGPLVIFINKETNRKWQYHGLTNQFMDETDSPIKEEEKEMLQKTFPDIFARMMDQKNNWPEDYFERYEKLHRNMKKIQKLLDNIDFDNLPKLISSIKDYSNDDNFYEIKKMVVDKVFTKLVGKSVSWVSHVKPIMATLYELDIAFGVKSQIKSGNIIAKIIISIVDKKKNIEDKFKSMENAMQAMLDSEIGKSLIDEELKASTYNYIATDLLTGDTPINKEQFISYVEAVVEYNYLFDMPSLNKQITKFGKNNGITAVTMDPDVKFPLDMLYDKIDWETLKITDRPQFQKYHDEIVYILKTQSAESLQSIQFGYYSDEGEAELKNGEMYKVETLDLTELHDFLSHIPRENKLHTFSYGIELKKDKYPVEMKKYLDIEALVEYYGLTMVIITVKVGNEYTVYDTFEGNTQFDSEKLGRFFD